MARAPKLKVYRTPIGFHDAYVAAPSQKAALKAWGSDADLFARGVAEQVTEPALIEEPLSKPGTVVRRSRGTVAEQIAALPADREKPKPRPSAASGRKAKPEPGPRPDRDALDKAEDELAQAKARQEEEIAGIERQQAELARRRKAIEKRHAEELAKLERARERAQDAYSTALRKWRG